jgi:hypothetical protein
VGGRGRDPPALGPGGRGGEVGDAASLRCVRGSGDEGYCRSCGPCRPTCYSHRAWQAYLLESARISQASAGARVAYSRKLASRAGRFSCACLHPYTSIGYIVVHNSFYVSYNLT